MLIFWKLIPDTFRTTKTSTIFGSDFHTSWRWFKITKIKCALLIWLEEKILNDHTHLYQMISTCTSISKQAIYWNRQTLDASRSYLLLSFLSVSHFIIYNQHVLDQRWIKDAVTTKINFHVSLKFFKRIVCMFSSKFIFSCI